MEERTNQDNEENKKEKSLQSDDAEIIKQKNPPEGSESISDAGKRREEGERYQ